MSIKDAIKPLHKVSIDRIERELRGLRDKLEGAVKSGMGVDVEEVIKDLDFIIELIKHYDPWVDIGDEEFHERCGDYCYHSINWYEWCRGG